MNKLFLIILIIFKKLLIKKNNLLLIDNIIFKKNIDIKNIFRKKKINKLILNYRLKSENYLLFFINRRYKKIKDYKNKLMKNKTIETKNCQFFIIFELDRI